MTVRDEVLAFARSGPLPSDDDETIDAAAIEAREAALKAIRPPVTNEEAALLATCFGDGTSSFGLAWTVLHLIETAPAPAVPAKPPPGANEWQVRLWQRHQNGPG